MSEQIKMNQVTEMSAQELDTIAGGASSETDAFSDFEKSALVEELALANGEEGSVLVSKNAKVDINSELSVEKFLK